MSEDTGDTRLLRELEERIEEFESAVCGEAGLLRTEHLRQLRRLYKTYESLYRELIYPDMRPTCHMRVTTRNAPERVEHLLFSVRDEILFFSYPAEKIVLMITDDSDCQSALERNRHIACEMFPWPFEVHYHRSLDDRCSCTHMAAGIAPATSLGDLSDPAWTITLSDTDSLGSYVKVPGETYEHHHAFSYFHRALRARERSRTRMRTHS